MKRKTKQIGSVILMGVALLFLLLPNYLREALIHLYPDITDGEIFEASRLEKADSTWRWPLAERYNEYTLPKEDSLYLDEYQTVAFLVIQHDSVVYEEYRDKWTPDKLVNIFSATKSIVSLLVGIAIDEGYIGSVNDKVSKYLPELTYGDQITIRNLLTMSSGTSFEESHSSLFSITTEAYYGDNLREIISSLEMKEEPGKRFEYRSSDTQTLAFLLESATSQSVAKYAEEKLWKPLQTENAALWSLDKEHGDEKGFCCFNTTARDLAHVGRMVLHHGDWNGRQIVSRAYLDEALTPAYDLQDEFGKDSLDYYGYQIWILNHKGYKIPYFRGLKGQYLYIIPELDALVVRMGHKRSSEDIRENTEDIPHYMDIALKILTEN